MSTERLTGTEEHPIERIPDEPSTFGRWVVAVGGPAVWITHFMAVYLVAEASCAGLETDEWSFIGEGSVVAFVVAATVVAALACAALAVLARRRMRADDRETVDFATIGFLLSIGSIIGVVAVGAPALFLSPIC
jgi:uncharacterized membrane protein